MDQHAITDAEWADHAHLLREIEPLWRSRLLSLDATLRRNTQRNLSIATWVIRWVEDRSTDVPAQLWESHAEACRVAAYATRYAVDRSFRKDVTTQAHAKALFDALQRVAVACEELAHPREAKAA